MSSLPRLVATDLDGTLLRDDGSVSPRSVEVLADLDRRGVPVVIVTGRPLRMTRPLFHLVGEHGIAVVSNGAVIWSVHHDGPVRVRDFGPGEVEAVAKTIRAAVPGSVFAVETLDGIALEPEFIERYHLPEGTLRAPIADLPHDGVVKLLARHEELPAQDFWDLALAAVGDRAIITWSSATALLEISAPGVTKATSLAAVCADLGLGHDDVAVFGDMPNDLPMIEWAGTSYAVANAHPSILAAADHVVGSNQEDGVAETLARLVDGDGSDRSATRPVG